MCVKLYQISNICINFLCESALLLFILLNWLRVVFLREFEEFKFFFRVPSLMPKSQNNIHHVQIFPDSQLRKVFRLTLRPYGGHQSAPICASLGTFNLSHSWPNYSLRVQANKIRQMIKINFREFLDGYFLFYFWNWWFWFVWKLFKKKFVKLIHFMR